MNTHGLLLLAKGGGGGGYRAVCLCGLEVRDSHSCDNVKAPTWDSLRAFVGQRVRLEGANYSDAASYRADRKRIDRDRADARELIRWGETWGVDPAMVIGRLSRLTWGAETGWDYIPGQYYPTEVFGAVCRAVSEAILQAHCDRERARGGEASIAQQAHWAAAYIRACGGRGSRSVARWFAN